MKHFEEFAEHIQAVPFRMEDCPVHLEVGLPGPSAYVRWPEFPSAARPEFGRLANGRGLTAAACRKSLIGEAIELVSIATWEDEPLIHGALSDLKLPHMGPIELVGLTEPQYAERDQWNAAACEYDWRPSRPDPSSSISWMRAEDHQGAPLLLPADAVLVGHANPSDQTAVALADSNGAASGETLDAARLTALLELIERDALARWWYGQRARPSVALDSVLEEAPEARRFFAWLKGRRRSSVLVDMTTDVGIPALLAVSAERDGRDVALGHAAALSPVRAAISALTEMVQMEGALSMVRALPEAPWTWATWRDQITMDRAPLSTIGEPGDLPVCADGGSPMEPRAGLDLCKTACQGCGIRLAFADRTRPQIGVPVAQVLSPDLCHFKPRFARSRLLASDVRDLDEAAREPNSVPLLV